ncbi:MAG: MBL fold metallo-hydrolase [Propionibacteriaceae bacterium]|jgi:glyoxylase-like metal-dependent hydrolase (beta-lactamase superfamily II)|nr:MBL fold metallo-hydrolase [Propionibacteriaceae bacterium]
MGASAVVAELPELVVRRVSVSSFDNNVYLITVRATGAQVLIDAADEPDTILALIAAGAADVADPAVPARLAAIVTTHSHHDHIRALRAIATATHAATLAGADDAAAIERATGVTLTRRLGHGDTLDVPGQTFGFVHLRGHTPGSVTLVAENRGAPTQLFTGDALFPGGVGNTDHDPARFAQLFGDVSRRLFDVFRDDAQVWPGHGAPTTLGAERPHLGEWEARGW